MNLVKSHDTHQESGEENADALNQYLSFQIKGESYAIGILSIREIIQYGRVTSVPMMPDFIHGVINLRGAVVPVIDLARRFGKSATQINRRTCVVLIELPNEGGENETQLLGLLVDTVNEVVDIPPEAVLPPPAFGSRIRSDFILGMGKLADDFIIVLNVPRILSRGDMEWVNQLDHSALKTDAN